MKSNTKTKKKIKVGDIIVDILLALALAVLALAIYTAFQFKENPEEAYLFGYKPVYILTGSMEPTLREKSVCIVKQSTYDEVDVGDIIMYTIEEKTITHRIVDKTEDGIRTRGDNNNVQDAYLIQPDQINGKVVMVFNFTATIVNDLQSGVYGYVKWIGFPIFSIVVIVVTVKVIKKILNSGDDDEDDQKKDKKKEKSEKEPAKIEESEPKSEEE